MLCVFNAGGLPELCYVSMRIVQRNPQTNTLEGKDVLRKVEFADARSAIRKEGAIALAAFLRLKKSLKPTSSISGDPYPATLNTLGNMTNESSSILQGGCAVAAPLFPRVRAE
jgi:hypothetical protein